MTQPISRDVRYSVWATDNNTVRLEANDTSTGKMLAALEFTAEDAQRCAQAMLGAATLAVRNAAAASLARETQNVS